MRPPLRARLGLPLSLFVCIACSSTTPFRLNVDGSEARSDAAVDWPPLAQLDGMDTLEPDTGAADTTVAADSSLGHEAGVSWPAPRVLLVDRNTDTFASYDLDGQQAHDYHSLLDFGAGFDLPWVSLAGNMARWTTANELTNRVWWLRPAQGRFELEPPSTLVVAAHQVGGDGNRIKLASMKGEVLGTFDLAGDFDGYALSPRQRYLLATKYGGNALVLRLSDQQVAWRGKGESGAAFSPDDRHFIAAYDPQVAFEIVNLETGRIMQPTLASLPFPFTPERNHVVVQAALDAGAVITADFGYGETLTEQLWWVDWDGKVTPFDPSLPQYAYEELVRWNAAGTKALWQRLGSSTPRDFPLGFFTFEVGSRHIQVWQDVGQAQGLDSTDCFDGRVATFYGVVTGSLFACACATGQCDRVADLPPITADWKPAVVVSPDRSVIAVHYYWMLSSRLSTGEGKIQLLRSTGKTLAELPEGSIGFDQSNTLALGMNWATDQQTPNVVNLRTGKVTTLVRAEFAHIAYE